MGQSATALEHLVQTCPRSAQEDEQDAGPDLNPALAVHDPRVELQRGDQASQTEYQAGVGDHGPDGVSKGQSRCAFDRCQYRDCRLRRGRAEADDGGSDDHRRNVQAFGQLDRLIHQDIGRFSQHQQARGDTREQDRPMDLGKELL